MSITLSITLYCCSNFTNTFLFSAAAKRKATTAGLSSVIVPLLKKDLKSKANCTKETPSRGRGRRGRGGGRGSRGGRGGSGGYSSSRDCGGGRGRGRGASIGLSASKRPPSGKTPRKSTSGKEAPALKLKRRFKPSILSQML